MNKLNIYTLDWTYFIEDDSVGTQSQSTYENRSLKQWLKKYFDISLSINNIIIGYSGSRFAVIIMRSTINEFKIFRNSASAHAINSFRKLIQYLQSTLNETFDSWQKKKNHAPEENVIKEGFNRIFNPPIK